MAALSKRWIAITMAWLILADAPARADAVDAWRSQIGAASTRFGIPMAWIEAVMRAESGGKTRWRGRPIISSAGAMGLMQLMPGTWSEMRVLHGLGSDPYDPHDNILGGAAYLAAMHARFGFPGLFGAYNAGPARYADHVRAGRPLPRETIHYMATIVAALGARDTQDIAPGDPVPSPVPPPLFVMRADTGRSAPAEPAAQETVAATDPLFALRRRY